MFSQRSRASSASFSFDSFPFKSYLEKTVCNIANSTRKIAISCVASSPRKSTYSWACSNSSNTDNSLISHSLFITQIHGSFNKLNIFSSILITFFPFCICLLHRARFYPTYKIGFIFVFITSLLISPL